MFKCLVEGGLIRSLVTPCSGLPMAGSKILIFTKYESPFVTLHVPPRNFNYTVLTAQQRWAIDNFFSTETTTRYLIWIYNIF